MSGGSLLLERDEELAILTLAMAAASGGQGSLILLGGEAGVGKTSLTRRFASTLGGTPVVTGACDPLPTPLALGPLLDMAPQLGPTFESLLDGSLSGRDLFAVVFSRLAALKTPVLLVFEDLHWADQATLELVGYLGRRVERLRALIIVSFRQEEVDSGGALALALGDLATAPGVVRLTLSPLSRAATARLAEDSSADVDELYRRTGGNPFYITEVLRGRSQDVPPTVRDAVLARLARLSPEARRALQVAAAIGTSMEPGLLAKVLDTVDTPRWSIQEAINAGLLQQHEVLVGFRHELARAAVVAATPPDLRQQLHRSILAELRRGIPGPDDYAALAGHAEAAGDDAAVLDLAPPAANRSAALGAHREAADLYGKAVARARHQPVLAADLLERRGEELYASRQFAEAMHEHRLAARLCQDLDDSLGAARNLIRVSYLGLAAGDPVQSEVSLNDATALLEKLPPSRELAIAYEARARRLFMSNQPRPAEIWAERAAELADRQGDARLALDAHITAAVARLLIGDDAGRVQLHELREAADRLSRTDHSASDTFARVTFYLSFIPLVQRRYDVVDRYLEEGWRYALDNDLEYWQSMMAGARVLRFLAAGRWHEAGQQADAILQAREPPWRARLMALVVLARIKARTGEPGAGTCLDEVTKMARGDLAVEGMVWPARVEAAWLVGDNARVLREATEAGGVLATLPDPWAHGEVAFWAKVAGGEVQAKPTAAEPYHLAVQGDWVAAASWWEQRGCPYEMALTLATLGDAEATRRAIAVFDHLGATPAAAFAAASGNLASPRCRVARDRPPARIPRA